MFFWSVPKRKWLVVASEADAPEMGMPGIIVDAPFD
jgi:hypothetical protein